MVERSTLLFVAMLCAGIGAGSGYTTFFAFNPAGESAASWLAHLQRGVPRIGIALFVVQPLAFLSMLALAVLMRGDRPSFWFVCAACAAMLAGALVTRVVHIPINQRLQTWSASELPGTLEALRQRWWTWHVVRVAALLTSFAALILAALTRRI